MLPPINLTAPSFWAYIFLNFIICSFIVESLSVKTKLKDIIINRRMPKFRSFYLFGGLAIIIALIFVINFINLPLFMSDAYANRITITDGSFNEDVKEVDFNKLALLDKISSSKLGDRVVGQMTDLVSQFTVSDMYTQINYKDEIVRVTPLEYAGIIKYFTNRSNGVAGYITVNSVNGEANLVRLDKGMKYMPSSLFFENLYRKLRISYPFTIFGDTNFEIDDDGNPYWIVETIEYKGVGLRKEVSGVIALNPIDGTSIKYDIKDVPSWIDHVYSADLIIEQVDDWGNYKNGFFNSIFGQKGVVMTTDGYNYLAMDDDIYLYTGITSVANDESNIGFILTNMRTKETKFYNVAGAEEYSAMASATGQVQQMNYTPTFPLLINLNDKPTYLMSLKDNAGLVKMYAFVDYADYQKVVVTDSSEGIIKAAQNYLGGNVTTGNEETKEIRIKNIKTAVLDGTTYYYIEADGIYRASIKVNQNVLPFLTAGDKVTIKYKKSDIDEIIEISN